MLKRMLDKETRTGGRQMCPAVTISPNIPPRFTLHSFSATPVCIPADKNGKGG
jgi:hypothetical protein